MIKLSDSLVLSENDIKILNKLIKVVNLYNEVTHKDFHTACEPDNIMDIETMFEYGWHPIKLNAIITIFQYCFDKPHYDYICHYLNEREVEFNALTQDEIKLCFSLRKKILKEARKVQNILIPIYDYELNYIHNKPIEKFCTNIYRGVIKTPSNLDSVIVICYFKPTIEQCKKVEKEYVKLLKSPIVSSKIQVMRKRVYNIKKRLEKLAKLQ